MAKNDKKFLIGVVGGGMSWRGTELSFFTRRRVARAVALGQSLSRSGIQFRYAVVPSSTNILAVTAIMQAIKTEHQNDDVDIVAPPADHHIKHSVERRSFVVNMATARGEYHLFV